VDQITNVPDILRLLLGSPASLRVRIQDMESHLDGDSWQCEHTRDSVRWCSRRSARGCAREDTLRAFLVPLAGSRDVSEVERVPRKHIGRQACSVLVLDLPEYHLRRCDKLVDRLQCLATRSRVRYQIGQRSSIGYRSQDLWHSRSNYSIPFLDRSSRTNSNGEYQTRSSRASREYISYNNYITSPLERQEAPVCMR
jgi:hypothetical protein